MAEGDWRTKCKALHVLHKFATDGSPTHAQNLKGTLRKTSDAASISTASGSCIASSHIIPHLSTEEPTTSTPPAHRHFAEEPITSTPPRSRDTREPPCRLLGGRAPNGWHRERGIFLPSAVNPGGRLQALGQLGGFRQGPVIHLSVDVRWSRQPRGVGYQPQGLHGAAGRAAVDRTFGETSEELELEGGLAHVHPRQEVHGAEGDAPVGVEGKEEPEEEAVVSHRFAMGEGGAGGVHGRIGGIGGVRDVRPSPP